jgi:hypothetical protein
MYFDIFDLLAFRVVGRLGGPSVVPQSSIGRTGQPGIDTAVGSGPRFFRAAAE